MIKNIARQIIRYTTIILMALSILFILLNSEIYYHGNFNFKVWMTLLFAVIIAVLIFSVYFFVKKCYLKKGFNTCLKIILALVTVAVVAFQLVYVVRNHMVNGWDVGVIINHASKTVILDEYFLRYYNNILLCTLFKGFFFLFGGVFNNNYWLMATLIFNV